MTNAQKAGSEDQVFDFIYTQLGIFTDEVIRQMETIGKDEYEAEILFHRTLLMALSIRLLCDGWNEDELLEEFQNDLDGARKVMNEYDESAKT